MLFAATYFYEAGFTVLLKLNSMKRNMLEVEDAIEINPYPTNVENRVSS